MTARLKDAHRAGIRVMTSSMTLIEAYHNRIHRAAWNWTLSRITVVPVTRPIADEAIALLKEAELHGHKYAIDAALAAIVRRQRGHVVVYTSDADDMKKLCGHRAGIRPL
jgi:predicted nucleic acid-binding protein